MTDATADQSTLGFGLGLRQPHYELVLENNVPVDWFEILSENYLEAHDGYWRFLADVRAKYPLVMHGVAMNIGGTDPIDIAYMTKLKRLAEVVKPVFISDHLCWTGVHGINSHDLLPIPYTKEALQHITSRIKKVQDMLGRQLVVENPSTYAEFIASSIPEWEFLAELAEMADCKLLLDVNNVYVSAYNHRYDAKCYIDAMPAGRIAYIHLAGHKNKDTHIIDTHDDHVADQVWELYGYTVQKFGTINTMIEWDGKIPAFDVLLSELDKARGIAKTAGRGAKP